MSICPIKPQVDGQDPSVKSLREVISQIDNEGDLRDYVVSHVSKVSSKPSEYKYERHPVRISLIYSKAKELKMDNRHLPLNSRLYHSQHDNSRHPDLNRRHCHFSRHSNLNHPGIHNMTLNLHSYPTHN